MRPLQVAFAGGEVGAYSQSVTNGRRPMVSPALVALNRDAFVIQDERETTVDLAGRHAATTIEDLDLDELESGAV